jgi:hypothetical protein
LWFAGEQGLSGFPDLPKKKGAELTHPHQRRKGWQLVPMKKQLSSNN